MANGVAVRVVPARPVVARTRLEREGSVAVVPPTARLSRASQRRLNHLGLHVDQHRPGDRRHVGRGRAADVGVVLVPVRLAEESSADARAVARGMRVDLGAQGVEELGANLVAALPQLDGDDAPGHRDDVPEGGTRLPDARAGGCAGDAPARFRFCRSRFKLGPSDLMLVFLAGASCAFDILSREPRGAPTRRRLPCLATPAGRPRRAPSAWAKGPSPPPTASTRARSAEARARCEPDRRAARATTTMPRRSATLRGGDTATATATATGGGPGLRSSARSARRAAPCRGSPA